MARSLLVLLLLGLINLVTPQQTPTCGTSNNNRISGNNNQNGDATPAAPNQFPWQALLQVQNIQSDGNVEAKLANGVLIGDQYVLTTLMDLMSTFPIVSNDSTSINLGVLVTLGAVSYDGTSQTEPSRMSIFSQNVVFHAPGWTGDTADVISILSNNDSLKELPFILAIITLPQPIDFNSNISPICLPNYNESDFIDQAVTQTGWGFSSYSANTGDMTMLSDKLLEISAKIVYNDECDGLGYASTQVDEWAMCVRKESNGTVCEGGLHGGPISNSTDGMTGWTLLGFLPSQDLLHDVNCVYFDPSQPSFSIGARIQPHLDWINAVLNNENVMNGTTTTPTPSSAVSNLKIGFQFVLLVQPFLVAFLLSSLL